MGKNIHNKKPLNWPVDERLLELIRNLPLKYRKRLCCFDKCYKKFENAINLLDDKDR